MFSLRPPQVAATKAADSGRARVYLSEFALTRIGRVRCRLLYPQYERDTHRHAVVEAADREAPIPRFERLRDLEGQIERRVEIARGADPSRGRRADALEHDLEMGRGLDRKITP